MTADGIRAVGFAALAPSTGGQDLDSQSTARGNMVLAAGTAGDQLLLLLATDRLSRTSPPEWSLANDGQNDFDPDQPSQANELWAEVLADLRLARVLESVV